MRIELVPQRVGLLLIQFLGVSIALSLLHYVLEVPNADGSVLVGGCEDMSLGLTEFCHGNGRVN